MSKVILHHQDTCGQCRAVEMMLRKNNIEFESNKDIETMKSKGITSTPALEVDGVVLKGKDIINWIKKGE